MIGYFVHIGNNRNYRGKISKTKHNKKVCVPNIDLQNVGAYENCKKHVNRLYLQSAKKKMAGNQTLAIP